MKNIHIISTDKPSRLLVRNDKPFVLMLKEHSPFANNDTHTYQNISITSDVEIKEGDWCYGLFAQKPFILIDFENVKINFPEYKSEYKKIILTTDQDLIKDGVQAIDDEFLEWFVKNPSCEFVETKRLEDGHYVDRFADGRVVEGIYENYKIIIPQQEHKPIHKFNNGRGATLCGKCRVIISEGLTEELYCERCKPKQETLEEAAKKLYPITGEYFDKEFYMVKRLAFIAGAKWQQEAILDLLKVNGYKDDPIFDLITEQLKKKIIMNNNLEFENEDPTPDSVENNHPRTNYGEGFTKQETVEEASNNFAIKEIEQCTSYHDLHYGFNEGAKWQAERMYSEEEVYELLLKHQSAYRSVVRNTSPLDWSFDIKQWFEQFKTK